MANAREKNGITKYHVYRRVCPFYLFLEPALMII